MTTDRRASAKLTAPTINLASVVYGLDAYMRSRGADAGDALRRARFEPGDLTDPDRRVPLIRYLELLEICADLLADPQFGLKFGAQYELRNGRCRQAAGSHRTGPVADVSSRGFCDPGGWGVQA